MLSCIIPVNLQMKKEGRILAVDWGLKHIGLAISDPTRTIARPLDVIEHRSRNEDARRIIEIAHDHQANQIVIGVSYDEEGTLSPVGRSADRLAKAIQFLSNRKMGVDVWDEGFSTEEARAAALEMDLPKEKRKGHLDALAAALILQRYLEGTQHEE